MDHCTRNIRGRVLKHSMEICDRYYPPCYIHIHIYSLSFCIPWGCLRLYPFLSITLLYIHIYIPLLLYQSNNFALVLPIYGSCSISLYAYNQTPLLRIIHLHPHYIYLHHDMSHPIESTFQSILHPCTSSIIFVLFVEKF